MVIVPADRQDVVHDYLCEDGNMYFRMDGAIVVSPIWLYVMWLRNRITDLGEGQSLKREVISEMVYTDFPMIYKHPKTAKNLPLLSYYDLENKEWRNLSNHKSFDDYQPIIYLCKGGFVVAELRTGSGYSMSLDCKSVTPSSNILSTYQEYDRLLVKALIDKRCGYRINWK